MAEEKYIIQTSLKEGESQIKLNLKLKDSSVTNSKIAQGAVTSDKIGSGEVKAPNIDEGAVGWESLDGNLQTIIASREEGGVALATDFGQSELIGITQKKLTEAHDDLQGQIDDIISSGAEVNINCNPTLIFANTPTNIAISATTNVSATSIVIKKNGNAITSGSGTSLSHTDEGVSMNQDGTYTYAAVFVIKGATKTKTKTVTTVGKIYYGSGATQEDVTTNLPNPKSSPAGTYSVEVEQNGQYVFFIIPSGMSINSAKLNGFDFPLESPETVTRDGVSYKSYRSSNTCDAGTYSIVIS